MTTLLAAGMTTISCQDTCKKHADTHTLCKDCMDACEACAMECLKAAG